MVVFALYLDVYAFYVDVVEDVVGHEEVAVYELVPGYGELDAGGGQQGALSGLAAGDYVVELLGYEFGALVLDF